MLIVEDEPDIAGLMKHALERGGEMQVEIVGTGRAALKSVMEEPPGLVLLDLNLPFIDGLEVCRLLRGRAVQRRHSHHHGHGADRAKPIGSPGWSWAPTTTSRSRSACESWSRACAPCSGAAPDCCRSRTSATSAGASAIDFDAVSVRVSGAPMRLTKREFELLRFLVENRNRVLSRDRLLERVWGLDRQVETRSVDVHVGRLRGKLGQPAGRSKRSSAWATASSKNPTHGRLSRLIGD